ncbi:TraR/DksA C4-type zinc finger protein [Pectobacteriaceae bacterium CE70]|uniref:Conjugal transfer protein TraR n=1 Tax=Serratia sp. (strain ATCC 39006) TaxID=104623 RepID=A0A2I5TBI6_SERS3|nr:MULTISPECIES: TraR/DksA C4-type zinc finger protein [Enterobacterales]WJV59203.1 TraR/DksA C4-type zinc finger protein [Pectobacteriaceae bacterium C111]WJV63456.1 TraR/DksA C4-type zinc finger protein [Pectobacteriaceae bacterium C52]WJV67838.1 TraR/DksA C4-type zinc finger protein [Pectobacteriaceae bacterium CE70]WJY11778.1 TraR/DksA C4-type zinc finger protein [Pectobacteriaceae bacterium C80]AUH01914.1 conjugal transfer protein TraR [Serratia sp. ATCC 39006]
MNFDLNDEMAQAVTEQQLRASLSQILNEVRSDKPSHHYCEDCGATIPEARRRAVRGVRFCVGCQEVREHHQHIGTGRNDDHR